MQRVNLVAYLTAPPKLAMMLQLVEAITFDILGVVATTRHSRTNDLTMSKALSRAIK